MAEWGAEWSGRFGRERKEKRTATWGKKRRNQSFSFSPFFFFLFGKEVKEGCRTDGKRAGGRSRGRRRSARRAPRPHVSSTLRRGGPRPRRGQGRQSSGRGGHCQPGRRSLALFRAESLAATVASARGGAGGPAGGRNSDEPFSGGLRCVPGAAGPALGCARRRGGWQSGAERRPRRCAASPQPHRRPGAELAVARAVGAGSRPVTYLTSAAPAGTLSAACPGSSRPARRLPGRPWRPARSLHRHKRLAVGPARPGRAPPPAPARCPPAGKPRRLHRRGRGGKGHGRGPPVTRARLEAPAAEGQRGGGLTPRPVARPDPWSPPSPRPRRRGYLRPPPRTGTAPPGRGGTRSSAAAAAG